MRILDLFAGEGGQLRRAYIEGRGHEYITLDHDESFGCTISADLFELSAVDLSIWGSFDFIWASPPCEAFSVASIGHHWGGGRRGYLPKTEHAIISQRLVAHTLQLIYSLDPSKGWLMENPMGLLRRLQCVAGVPKVTITYCQYGHSTMKPTDIWGHLEGWIPREACKNGAKCHESAPRGSRTGVQGIDGAAERAIVPMELWGEILDVLEGKSAKSGVVRRQSVQNDLFQGAVC